MKIGFVGAGNIGQGLAKLATAEGYQVTLSNSRGPESLQEVASSLGVEAATTESAVLNSDLVVLTVPLLRVYDLKADIFAGKVVMDTCNYYPTRDGLIEQLANNETTTSELVQTHFVDAVVVKAFNAIMAGDLVAPFGLPSARRALPIASNDSRAAQRVAAFHDRIGFDTVILDDLSDSWRFERAKPGYCIPLDRAGLTQKLAEAERDVELPHNSWKRS